MWGLALVEWRGVLYPAADDEQDERDDGEDDEYGHQHGCLSGAWVSHHWLPNSVMRSRVRAIR